MAEERIGGFVVKDLGIVKSKKDSIKRCVKCGRYRKESELKVVDKFYNCKSNCK